MGIFQPIVEFLYEEVPDDAGEVERLDQRSQALKNGDESENDDQSV